MFSAKVSSKWRSTRSSDLVVTQEILRSELQSFMDDTLESALTGLQHDVVNELKSVIESTVYPDCFRSPDRASRASKTGHERHSRASKASRPSIGLGARMLKTFKKRKRIDTSQSDAGSSSLRNGLTGTLSYLDLDSPKLTKQTSSPWFAEGEETVHHSVVLPERQKTDIVVRSNLLREETTMSEFAEYRYLLPESDLNSKPSNRDRLGRWAQFVRKFTRSSNFDFFIVCCIFTNSILLGIETDQRAGGAHHRPFTTALEVADLAFALIFCFELALRISSDGCKTFFTREWNIFDFVIVVFQVAEHIVKLLLMSQNYLHGTLLWILHLLQGIRILRLVRIIPFVKELYTIASSIVASMMALFWTLLLLLMFTYITSVFFTQVVSGSGSEGLDYWYGNLPRSVLTMFEVIVGGVSWDEVAHPLIQEVSPFMGIVLCMYIAFCVFAIMNMATGVFVERATRRAQEDKDTYTANHISSLFFKGPQDEEYEVTWDVFSRKLDTPEMQEYFKELNVDPSEAKGLFQLLDVDGSGTLSGEELVDGCLRLRGAAKALELSLLMFETHSMHMSMLAHHEKTEMTLSTMQTSLQSLQNGAAHSPDKGMDSSGAGLRIDHVTSMASSYLPSELGRVEELCAFSVDSMKAKL